MYAETQQTGRMSARARPDGLDELVVRYGVPLLILDPNAARERYRELQAAFPFLRLHYDASALAHPTVISAIAECDGYFEVSEEGALAALQASHVDPARAMHTHPVKHPQDLLAAYNAGVRIFVVDSQPEVEKFIGYPDDVRIVLRVRFPSAHQLQVPAVVHGVTIDEAPGVVRFASSLGVRIHGFSLLLSGDRRGAQPYAAAISRTLGLMVELEETLRYRFDVLDLGPDFPTADHSTAVERAEIARAVRTLLLPLANRLTILAEPGRSVAARCLTLVTNTVQVGVEPHVASESIDAGASLVVADSRHEETASLFTMLADTRHRIFHPAHPEKRAAQTRAAAG